MHPQNLAFNAAVYALASRVLPRGYDVAGIDTDTAAPSTLAELNAVIAGGRMIVDGANSAATIFADPEVNYAFRAWHDWTHWHLQAPFTVAGECAVACRQIADLAAIFGRRFADQCKPLIYAEVIGQALAYDISGTFPADQVAFDAAFLGVLAA